MIKDAAYDVMLNSKLNKKFINKYNEFPALYDKHKNKYKSSDVTRIYTKNIEDYEKIAGVLFEATKNPKIEKEVSDILMNHFVQIVDNFGSKVSAALGKEKADETNRIVYDYLSAQIYYEYHYIYIYMKKYCKLKNIPVPITRDECYYSLTYNYLQRIFKSSNDLSFKTLSSTLDKEIKVDLPNKKFEDPWQEFFELAKENFGVNKTSLGNWGNFIRHIDSFKPIEGLYLEVIQRGFPRKTSSATPALKQRSTMDSLTETIGISLNPRNFSFGLAFTYEIILSSMDKIRMGIDMPMILIKNSLNDKEIRNIIYRVKHGRDFKGEEPNRTIPEWCNVVQEIVRVCTEELLIKNYFQSLKTTKTKTVSKNNNKSLNLTLLKLQEENNTLSKLAGEAKYKEEKLKKDFNSEKKELLSEIHDLQSYIKELEAKLATENEEEDIVDIKEDIEPEKEFAEDEFRDFISKHNVLVWGLRQTTVAALEKKYPELKFVESDKALTVQQINSCDAAIINICYTSHSGYYSARSKLKTADVPMAVLKNESNNDYWLWKACEELSRKICLEN